MMFVQHKVTVLKRNGRSFCDSRLLSSIAKKHGPRLES